METIVNDVTQLHQPSENVNDNEKSDIISKLIESIPEKALGLAAPQIGILKRAFIANFSFGTYILINPEITSTSSEQIPSTEGCLSLSSSHCINRFTRVSVKGEAVKCEIANINNAQIRNLKTLGVEEFKTCGLDACIVQHEIDHLNGVLIADRPQTKTLEEKSKDRYLERMKRLQLNRQAKKMIDLQKRQKGIKHKELSRQEIEKEKKREYKERKKMRKLIEKMELNLAIKEGVVKTDNESDTQK